MESGKWLTQLITSFRPLDLFNEFNDVPFPRFILTSSDFFVQIPEDRATGPHVETREAGDA